MRELQPDAGGKGHAALVDPVFPLQDREFQGLTDREYMSMIYPVDAGWWTSTTSGS